MKRTTLLNAALLAAAWCALPAHAHGDAAHAVARAVAEQTPWGIAGQRADARRTLALDMTDAMRFVPDAVTVQEGETVRFVVRNTGRMRHELVIGTPAALAEHAEMMAKHPDMEHDEPYMVHVEPGQAGEIVWHFNRPGRFEFACLIAGHYQAGMRGTLIVQPRSGAKP